MGLAQRCAAAAVAALCVAFTLGAYARSHHVMHPAPPGESAPAQERIREPLPVVIVAQPPMPEGERQALEAERAQKTSSDAALVTWTKVLGVATLVLACGTLALWWATRRLVLGADATAERQLRSYLFVAVHVENGILATPSGNAQSQIMVRVTNHGSTPAQLIKIRALAQVLERPPTDLPEGLEDEIPSGVVIGPQYIEQQPVVVRVSSDDLAEMERGNRAIYCFGRVEYEDVLGIRRQTGFCWTLDLRGLDQVFTITPNTRLNHWT
jgi:hypothetical protein